MSKPRAMLMTATWLHYYGRRQEAHNVMIRLIKKVVKEETNVQEA